MAKRIGDTAERFIENNLGADGRNTEVMEHLMYVSTAGRGKDYNEAVKKVQRELEGNLLQDKISSARMAFIYLQIMNNIRVITDPEDQDNKTKVTYKFRPKPQFLRFTSSLERNQTGGWNKSGMTLYMKMIERETKERKKMALAFAGELRTKRCNYFHPIEDSENDEDNDSNEGKEDTIEYKYEDEFPGDDDEDKASESNNDSD
eukprot:scaffold36508_cov44-Attheya_sp.AAC.2